MAGYLLASIVLLQLGMATFGNNSTEGHNSIRTEGHNSTIGVPLPAFCWGERGDKTVPEETAFNQCPEKGAHRSFFHKTKHCKKFSLCQSLATYLDREAGPTVNYFQNSAECEEACTNVVECLHEPLEIDNGYPVILTEEGEERRVVEGEKLGNGARVGFKCNEGYQLMKEECSQPCQKTQAECANCSTVMVPLEFIDSYWFCHLNGSWNNTRPYCTIQCPKPDSLAENVSFTPMKNFYDTGEQMQLDCKDGSEGNTSTWTCQENGTWEGQVPTCSPSCAPPPVDNAHPPAEGDTNTFTYNCKDGYFLLDSGSTLRCNNGQLEGEPPVCTKAAIRTVDNVDVPMRNGMYHYDLREGSIESELTCVLEGLEENEYNTMWILSRRRPMERCLGVRCARKSTGVVPPAVTTDGNSLIFTTAHQEQNGEYICHISGLTVSVIVEFNGTTDVYPPNVLVLSPEGVLRRTPGDSVIMYTLISGSPPLQVYWRHNGSNINSTGPYLIENVPDTDTILSTLTITDVQDVNQGVYTVVASNSGGSAMSSDMVKLMIDQHDEGDYRFKRNTPFCSDPKKVVLVGVVRRTGRTQSGLQSIRLKVDRVLRGDARGISRRNVNIHIFSGANTERLRRGQTVILSGVPHKGRIVYMFNTPIEDYSQTLENTIVDKRIISNRSIHVPHV